NHNRYSEWEAEVYSQLIEEPLGLSRIFRADSVWRRRTLKRLWVRLPFRPLARFLLFYILRRGFLDGRQGLSYSILMAYYEFLISLKCRELERANRQGNPAQLTERSFRDAPHA